MSISNQSNGTHAVSFMVQNKRYRYSGFASVDDAELFEKQARNDVKKGKEVTPPNFSKIAKKAIQDMTVGFWLNKTYRMYWQDKASPEKIRLKMKEATAWFGNTTCINDITTVSLDDWILHLKAKGNANGTINRKLAIMSKMLKYADESVRLNHFPKIHRQQERNGRVRYVTPDEEIKIMATLDHWHLPDLKDSISVLIDTGLRRSELGKLKPKDVEGTVIEVWDGKGNIDRTVPMTKRVREIMARRVQAQERVGNLFPVNIDTLSRNWDKVRFHLGYDDLVLHCFRHTTASRLVQRGIGLKTVKEWMGHLVLTTTLRYAHLSPKNLEDAVAVLEQ